MASRLGALARRAAAPRALLPTRGGGGGPVALAKPPTQPLVEEDELTWDDGSVNPEKCLDEFPLFTKYQALASLCAGLGVFGLVGYAAKVNDKPSKMPYTPKQFPYDNLKVELGDHQQKSSAKR